MIIQIDKPGTYELKLIEPTEPPKPEPIGFGKQYLAIDPSVWSQSKTTASFKMGKLTNVRELNINPSGASYPVSTFHDGRQFHHFVWNQHTNQNDYYTSHDGARLTYQGAIAFERWIESFLFKDGWAYGVVVGHDKTHYNIVGNQNQYDYTEWAIVESIPVTGAVDTQLSFGNTADMIFGRSRGALDWATTDPIMMDRRGVKVNLDNIQTNYIDPAVVQPNYATAQIRRDYYSMHPLYFQGNAIYHISTFFKDSKRVPLTRSDRITGTGEIYPTLFVNGQEIHNPSDSLIDLDNYRRDWYHKDVLVSKNEVGQIYSGSIIPLGDTTLFYYCVREDTHYYKPPKTNNRHYVGQIDGAQFGSYRSGYAVTKWLDLEGDGLTVETNGIGTCTWTIETNEANQKRITFNLLNGCELFGFKSARV
jgi:hypothetical protein